MLSDADANNLLIRWGKYERDLRHYGMGYPSESPEGRIRREGGVLQDSQGVKPLPHDDVAEQVELIMVRIRKIAPNLYHAASRYYVDGWKMVRIAGELEVSEETVRKDYLVRVRSIVAGAMTDWDIAS